MEFIPLAVSFLTFHVVLSTSMCKMITISLAQCADIDSCCLYTNREVANSAAALGLHS